MGLIVGKYRRLAIGRRSVLDIPLGTLGISIMPIYPTTAHCGTRHRQSVPESIDINTLKPNTSEITTGQGMELLPQMSIFPHGKRVIAHTYNSRIRLNGVQGVAGSNPAVPILPPRLRGQNRFAVLSVPLVISP